MADTDDRTRTVSVRKHEIWVWPVCIGLSVTAFVAGWVIITAILASKDINIAKIQHSVVTKER